MEEQAFTDEQFMDAIAQASQFMMKDRENTYSTIKAQTEDWTDEQLFNLMGIVGTITRSNNIDGLLDDCLHVAVHGSK